MRAFRYKAITVRSQLEFKCEIGNGGDLSLSLIDPEVLEKCIILSDMTREEFDYLTSRFELIKMDFADVLKVEKIFQDHVKLQLADDRTLALFKVELNKELHELRTVIPVDSFDNFIKLLFDYHVLDKVGTRQLIYKAKGRNDIIFKGILKGSMQHTLGKKSKNVLLEAKDNG